MKKVKGLIYRKENFFCIDVMWYDIVELLKNIESFIFITDERYERNGQY